MRILFLIRSLNVGGAEQQLATLAAGLRRAGHEVAVSVFYPGGRFERDLAAAGVPVIGLGKRGRWDVSFLARFVGAARRFGPDVVHAYLGTANEIVAVLRPILGNVGVVWGVRSAYIDVSRYDSVTRWSYRLEPLLSRFTDAVVVNSEAGRRHAEAAGFDREKLVVVPNGIDCQRFARDAAGRLRWRERWGVKNEIVVGLVGRLDAMKDHPTFLRAAADVAKARPDVLFACVGDGPVNYRRGLQALAKELGLDQRMRWEPATGDVSAVYSALDVFALSSYGEGFPNVVAEAMACGTPCVVTEVGDAASIVADSGVVVPARKPEQLARGIEWLSALNGEQRDEMGARARSRVERHYSVDALVRNTVCVLERVRASARR